MAEKKGEDLMIEARNFFNFYKKEIGKSVRAGKHIIYVEFDDLSSFSHTLAEQLISSPEEIFQVLEVALEESGLVSSPRVRLSNIPEMQFIKVRNIRAKHLNQLISVEGIIRQASDVRPQVVNAKFECPSCGTIISVLQIDKRFREPSRCSCGRKGQFNLVTKEMVDAQRIVIEESPESLMGGEQPRRMSVFLKEDLVEPKMEEKTTPGARVKIIGILKEVPVPLQTGAISTRFDLAIEANNIIPLEETFEEFEISEEDERQIQELAADKAILQKMTDSIAPSIYGYDEIKQSLVLQLFGGVKKKRADETDARGDIHILLVGDPGVAKSLSKNEKILYSEGKKFGYISIEKLFEKFGKYPKTLKTLTIDMKNHEPKWEKVSEIIKHLPEKDLIKIKTEHGKTITATKDHSFITLSKSGEIIPIKGEELTKESYVPIPINYHIEEISYFLPGQFNKKNTNSKILPEKIKLDRDFGFFIGIFLAEGYIRSGNAIDISNKNKEIQNKIIKFSKKININYHINEKGVLLYSKNLSDILMAYCYNLKDLKLIKKGVKGNFSRIKKIPDFAYFSPKEFIYGLLSGLFSGDGRLIQDKKMLKGFELTTVSRYLAEYTSELLFSIGIINKIKTRAYIYKGNKTDYFSLSVPTYMIRKFLDNIKIYGRYIKTNEKDPIYSYNNLIPCGSLIYELVKKLGYNSRISWNRTLAAEMRTVRKRNTIGRLRLLRLIKEFESKTKERIPELEILKKIANSNIIWSKIKEIEILKKKNEEVYDLSIPSTNTFVANGIGVHNSIILKFMSMLAPKGRYVVGGATTGAGVTATVVRDEFLRGWALEAGAMVLSNKGMICIDEIDKMNPEDRSAMHEAMEQQCYLPDLNITLVDNSKEKIGLFVDSLIEKNKGEVQKGIDCEILSLDKDIKILTTDFESIYPTRIDKVSRHVAPNKFVKIKLNNGREIIITPEHPCWFVDDGKITTIPAEKLKAGEFFPIPSELPIEGEEQNLPLFQNSPQLCKILGYHITDGCYELNRGKKNGIQFCNNDKRLIEDYFNSAKTVFNINPIITKRDKQFAVRIISKKVVDFFNSIDKNLMEKGKLKKIPEKIMKCKKEDISFLLRSLFDGDGTVVNVKRNGCRISLISENIELAEQINELLLRFGIISSIYKDREFFKLDICGQENLLKFYQNIGFLSEKKQDRLKEYLNKQKTYRSISDIIPNVTSAIKKMFKHLKINEEKYLGNQICMNCHKHRLFLQKMIKIAEEKVDRLIHGKEIVENTTDSEKLGEIRKKLELSTLSISKKLGISDYMLEQNEKRKTINEGYQKILILEIEEMLSILPELKEIKKLAFGKVRWAKIISVEVIKNKEVKWVYDITVEPTHSFISNNMVLHNSVTISKANVQASLRAETSVLAAANPKLGRFEPFQVIAQQIDLPPTLLNRFDVIFIMRDLPDRGRDEAIATHVLLEHKKEGKSQVIDKELFRKYIAYAKQKISPALTDAAVDEIKKFYVELRNAPVSAEGVIKPIPISARQLEAMVRLSEATAKARLSKKVTKEDAKLAIGIMKYYLMQVGFDQETKTFDIDRISTGISTSQRGRIILVREALSRLENRMGKLIPIEELQKELGEKMVKEDIEESIQKLKQTGDIFEPRKGYVQRV